MSTSDLEKRLQYLEDIEAIKQLKALYCKYADTGEHADEFAALFTEDAILDEGDDGVFSGRHAIRDMYRQVWSFITLNQHLVLSPIIDVDGDTARGEWRLLQLFTTRQDDGDKAFWACGEYQDVYVKNDGRWRFKRVQACVHFCCPYEDGWAKTPFSELAIHDNSLSK